MRNPNPKLDGSRRAPANKALGAGLTLAAGVGSSAYAGLWLDARFGSKPWLLLLCVGLGILGGMLHIIRVLAPELWPFRRSSERGRPPVG